MKFRVTKLKLLKARQIYQCSHTNELRCSNHFGRQKLDERARQGQMLVTGEGRSSADHNKQTPARTRARSGHCQLTTTNKRRCNRKPHGRELTPVISKGPEIN